MEKLQLFFSFSEIIIDKGRKADIMEYVLQKDKKWSVGQGVKTPPFHGGNTRMTVNHDVVGSSPTGGARFKKSNV